MSDIDSDLSDLDLGNADISDDEDFEIEFLNERMKNKNYIGKQFKRNYYVIKQGNYLF